MKPQTDPRVSPLARLFSQQNQTPRPTISHKSPALNNTIAGKLIFGAALAIFAVAFAFRLQLWLFSIDKSPWTDLFRVDVERVEERLGRHQMQLPQWPAVEPGRRDGLAGLQQLAPLKSPSQRRSARWPAEPPSRPKMHAC